MFYALDASPYRSTSDLVIHKYSARGIQVPSQKVIGGTVMVWRVQVPSEKVLGSLGQKRDIPNLHHVEVPGASPVQAPATAPGESPKVEPTSPSSPTRSPSEDLRERGRFCSEVRIDKIPQESVGCFKWNTHLHYPCPNVSKPPQCRLIFYNSMDSNGWAGFLPVTR